MAYYALLFQERLKHKKICAVYGEGTVTDQTCQKWFGKFCAGDFSLNDAPRSGRPVEVNSDEIETLYHVGDSWYTQNIQINTIMGENQKRVLFYGKKPYKFFCQPNTTCNSAL